MREEGEKRQKKGKGKDTERKLVLERGKEWAVRRSVLESDEQEGKKWGKREKFDYSRWADYYCATGRKG